MLPASDYRSKSESVLHLLVALLFLGAYDFRNSSGSLAMPVAIQRAASRVNNIARDRRPTAFSVIDEYQRPVVAGLHDKRAADILDRPRRQAASGQ
jgi:hypothetical protein